MPRSELALPPFTGLYLPDSSSETPLGSLAMATNIDVTDAGGAVQRAGTNLSTVDHTSVQYAFVHQQSTPQYVVMDASTNWQVYTAGTSSLTAGSSGSTAPTSPSGSCQMLISALSTGCTEASTMPTGRQANWG